MSAALTVEAVDPPGSTVLLPCGCPARLVRDVGLHQDGCPRGDLNIVHGPPSPPPYVPDDGGRAAAGFKGTAGDCVTRALAIATGRDYREVYGDLSVRQAAHIERIRERRRREQRGHLSDVQERRFTRARSVRNGVSTVVSRAFLAEAGASWTPTMSIGSGTLIHVRADELPPAGRHVLRLSGHLAAWVDGVLRDSHDCSREGTRAVYGYWTLPDL